MKINERYVNSLSADPTLLITVRQANILFYTVIRYDCSTAYVCKFNKKLKIFVCF